MKTLPIINLTSDTVTRPTPGMLQMMMSAELGDDVFREDPTVNHLEQKISSLFGHEAGLFCPSGTMTNQIAIKGHTQALDELICEYSSHVYQYEVAGYAFHSNIGINPIICQDGKLTPQLIREHIKPAYDWLPTSRLVVLENSILRYGGNYYLLDEIKAISQECQSLNLKLHLDGARIFNAIVEANYTPLEIGKYFDSISICLSKGLGAPVGSVLIGSDHFIKHCRKIRKAMGGGMRQAGILAAAGIYALDNHIDRLKIDHFHALQIEACLKDLHYVDSVKKVKTNIILFDLKNEFKPQSFIEQLSLSGVKAAGFGKQTIRFVTHLDITQEMIDRLCYVLKEKIQMN
jgi:threonine aldolase